MSTFEEPGRDEPGEPATVPHGLDVRVGSALSMLGTGLGEMYELERSERYLREHIAYAEEHDLERGLAPEDDPLVQPEPETPRDDAKPAALQSM